MSLLGKSHFNAWIQLFQHIWMSPCNHQKIYSQRANTCCCALKFKETRKTFKIVHMCALIHLHVCGSLCAQICENCDEKELVKIETGEGNYWCVRVLCVCMCTYTPLSLSLSRFLRTYVYICVYRCFLCMHTWMLGFRFAWFSSIVLDSLFVCIQGMPTIQKIRARTRLRNVFFRYNMNLRQPVSFYRPIYESS